MTKLEAINELYNEIVRYEKISLDFGFYWENVDQIIEQIRSECLEIKEAYEKREKFEKQEFNGNYEKQNEKEKRNTEHLKEEIGDVMHACISLAVYCGFDPLESLRISAEKYCKRLDSLIEFAKQDGLDNLKGKSMKTLMEYWNKAKVKVGQER